MHNSRRTALTRLQAGDIAWMITSTALVLLMIPGVGYVHIRKRGTRSTKADDPSAVSSILVSLGESLRCL